MRFSLYTYTKVRGHYATMFKGDWDKNEYVRLYARKMYPILPHFPQCSICQGLGSLPLVPLNPQVFNDPYKLIKNQK